MFISGVKRKNDNTVGTELLEFRQPYYDNDTRKSSAIQCSIILHLTSFVDLVELLSNVLLEENFILFIN